MIVAVYKEKGLTSRAVVNRIVKITKEKKVGHAGTLDPLASGVLIIGVGKDSTKKLHTPEFNEKEYLAIVKLGEESSTDDNEGIKTNTNTKDITPSEKEVTHVISKFIGQIEQTPSAFSAVKISGKEAYKYARKGISVKVPKRKVTIKEIILISYRYPYLKIKVTTSKGVYIRSLARDIGKKLKTGGYLNSLERTRVGKYTVKDCVPDSYFEKL